MGDRTWLQLTLHGHVHSLRALVEITKAICHEGLTPGCDGDYKLTEVNLAYKYIGKCLGSDNNPQFTDNECNYASIDEVEAVLQKHGVAYFVAHEDGGEYGAACWSWLPEPSTPGLGCKYEALLYKGDIVLDVETVRRAVVEGASPSIADILEKVDQASGKDLPTFSADDKVKRILAARLAASVLLNRAA